ncbi:MAG: UDP-glucose 4-epimerase GalE [Coriobacteriia bacterium]|nr:UDP-glucose 4-epimerase GalE [Coriobacteriia bacterium]
MRILATGGAGYIGSVTTRLLCDAGHDVVVLDTLERGYAASVDGRARLVQGSVGDRDAVCTALEGVDAVLHLAGYIEVAESQVRAADYLENNAVLPMELVESMLERGVDAIVFSSTAAVYGEPESIPINEDAPTRPVNVYGASKLMFERMLDWYGSRRGLRSVRLRYFNVAGAWPDGSIGEAHDPETHIIPRILGAVASGQRQFEVYGSDYDTPDRTCVRDYIHVCDLAEAHRLALEYVHSGGQTGVFNLGNGEGYSNLDVVRTCAQVVGSQIEVVFGDRRSGDPAVLVASASLAEEVLGWRPERPELARIATDAWTWHSTHPKGYRAVEEVVE